jgi:hypothetical protein
MPFDREQMKVKAAELAAKGVFVGTSSWEYELCRSRHNKYFPTGRNNIHACIRKNGSGALIRGAVE